MSPRLGCSLRVSVHHPGVVELKPRTNFFGLLQSLAISGRKHLQSTRSSRCCQSPIHKLLSLHLTYTQLALAQAHLQHLQRTNSSRLKHNLCTRSSLFCSKHFLFFSRVASGIQGVKATSNEPGVPLYR